VIAQEQDDSWSYYGYDGLGSARTITDAGGELLYGADYNPYGAVTAEYGGADSSLGFTGESTDASGLLYLRARYLNTTIGAFLTTDPVYGMVGSRAMQWNPYLYAGANPVNWLDPSGEFLPLVPILLGAAAAAAIGAVAAAAIGAIREIYHQKVTEGRCWDCMDWGKVGKAAKDELIPGALAGLASYFIVPLVLMSAPVGLPAMATGAMAIFTSGVTGGQVYRAAHNALNEPGETDYRLFNPIDMVVDGVLGMGLFKLFGGNFSRLGYRPNNTLLSPDEAARYNQWWDDVARRPWVEQMNVEDATRYRAYWNNVAHAQAQTAAEDFAVQVRGLSPRPSKATAFVSRATGQIYRSASGPYFRPDLEDIHPLLRSRMPAVSQHSWSVNNCAEVSALNDALWAGENIGDLVAYTVDVRTLQPWPRCLNCIQTTTGVSSRSDNLYTILGEYRPPR